ncbi:MAG: sugar phosphate isomerase/epimerase family protein [bacterium]
MKLTRRAHLKTLGFAAGLCLAPTAGAVQTRQLQRIGVQLYTVRDLMANDVPATLAAVAQAGYVEVETAGTGNLSPARFAAALGNTGLAAPAAHMPFDLMANSPETILEVAETVGYQFIVLPWIAPELRTLAGYTRVIQVLNSFGEQCQSAGRQLCYHNHDFEFASLGDETAFDLLLRQCDAQLVQFELDFFWAAHAGVDAAAYLRADPARFPLCHVKDRTAAGDMVSVGEGEIDFSALFAAGSGLQHYFVEHDRPEDSLASVRRSIQSLQALRY